MNQGKLRYEVVTDELSAFVSELPAGTKLPSVRNLMRRFNGSQATVDRSLLILEERSQIRRIQGRGYFRSSPAPAEDLSNRSLRIDFCFFLLPDAIRNAFYSVMVPDALQSSRELNCIMNIFVLDPDASAEDFRARIQMNRFDGLLMLGSPKVVFGHILHSMKIPFIQIFPNSLDNRDFNCLTDNARAVRLGVDHLVELGHRQIAYLHGQGFGGCYMLAQEERIMGFYESMRMYGLSVTASQVKYGGFTAEEGYAAARELLALPPELRPTAIFGNDHNVAGIYRAVHEAGLRIPEDISVMGFDNIPSQIALNPQLTSVEICYHELVAEQMGHLVDMIRKKEQQSGLVRSKVRLFCRESTGPVNNTSKLQVSAPKRKRR